MHTEEEHREKEGRVILAIVLDFFIYCIYSFPCYFQQVFSQKDVLLKHMPENFSVRPFFAIFQVLLQE